MPITTPWTEITETGGVIYSTTAAYPNEDGTLGSGAVVRTRLRRHAGQALWAVEVTLGTSPSYPAGPLIVPCGSESVEIALGTSGGIVAPGAAMYDDASDSSGGYAGTADLSYETFIPVGGVGAQVLDLFLHLYWSGGRLSSTVPVAPGAGDVIRAGNALEAFDN